MATTTKQHWPPLDLQYAGARHIVWATMFPPTPAAPAIIFVCLPNIFWSYIYIPIASNPKAPVSAGDIKELDETAAAVKSKAAPPATTGKFTEKSN